LAKKASNPPWGAVSVLVGIEWKELVRSCQRGPLLELGVLLLLAMPPNVLCRKKLPH